MRCSAAFSRFGIVSTNALIKPKHRPQLSSRFGVKFFCWTATIKVISSISELSVMAEMGPTAAPVAMANPANILATVETKLPMAPIAKLSQSN